MGLITHRTAPADVPTTDALASIPRDLLGPIPAEIRLGANTLMVMENAPDNGETVTIVARLRIWRTGTDQQGEDAEERHFRQGKIVAAWVQGQPEPPDPDAEQPSLFEDEDDDQRDGHQLDGEYHDEPATDEPEVIGDILAGVDRPGFSDSDNA